MLKLVVFAPEKNFSRLSRMSPHVCSLAGLLARVPVCLLQARLEQLDFVKDVHPERQITRALLAADGDADGGRGGDGS